MSDENLDERIASLHLELKSYSTEIVNQVKALYGENLVGSQFDLKKDPFSLLKILQHDAKDLLKLSEEKSRYEEVYDNELKDVMKLLGILQSISLIIDKLSDCEENLKNNDFMKATTVIHEIDALLSDLPSLNTEIGTGEICLMLRKQRKLINYRLLSKLKSIIKESITFEYGCLFIKKEIKANLEDEKNFDLFSIWEVIEENGKSEEIIIEVLKKLWVFVIRPLWKEKKSCIPRLLKNDKMKAEMIFEHISNEGAKGGISQSMSANNEDFNDLGSCSMHVSDLLDSLAQIFGFLWSEVFVFHDKSIETAISLLTSSKINVYKMLINCITTNIPKNEADLPNFRKNLENHCINFDKKLKFDNKTESEKMGIEEEISPLIELLNDLISVYSDLRRREILQQARELVVADYHNTMVAVGDASEDELSSAGDIGDPRALLDQSGSFAMQKLKFDSCQTSLAACRLLKLVHEVMKQSSTCTSLQVAKILYQSARDCLEIFMAVVPIKFSESVNTVPRMGAVFYNDCLYIAHNSILITHRYRLEFSKFDGVLGDSLKDSVGFTDFIPQFRSLGDECMKTHLIEQRSTLLELVKRINLSTDGNNTSKSLSDQPKPGDLIRNGLQFAESLGNQINLLNKENNDSDNRKDGLINNDEDSALRVLQHLQRLSGQWRGVLQDSVYVRLLGFLLESALRDIMTPILKTEFISESSAAEISRVFKCLLNSKNLFLNEGKDIEILQKNCFSWNKFVALSDLLDYSLSEVAEWLPRKKFSSFTGNEMTSLIKALFEDTPRRQTVLTSILEMSS